MTVTFDTSAWIEYFAGTDLGRNVKKYVDSMDIIYTPTIDLLEIKNKYEREKKKWKSRIDFICGRSTIVDIDREIALLAADMKKDFGLYSIDAIIYATARLQKSKLLTKDGHFEGLKDVIMLK
jgi:predicted nucleic acid-binding protein